MRDERNAGRVVAGRYRLESELGRGGMGVVWLAADTLMERRVALKELRVPSDAADDDDSFVERALREARNAGRLNHPAVVGVYDVIAPSGDDDAVYIVMEYVEAPTLAEVLDREGPLPAHRVAEMGLGILDGLVAAHAVGIVHRDIKPANVLVRDGGRVKLTDFGIALAAEDTRLTRSGVIGTHAYLAPECFDSGQVGPASDLWALGATLFHAVAGQAPFDRATTTETLRAILFEDPPDPPCDPPLAAAITGLLTRPIEERLTSVDARHMLEEVSVAAADSQLTGDAAAAGSGQASWEAQATSVNRPPATPQPTQPDGQSWGQPTQPDGQPWGQPTQPTAQPSPYVTAQPGQPSAPLRSQGGPGTYTYGSATNTGWVDAAPAPQRNSNTPWIIGGVLALGVILLIVIFAASGGDDDGGNNAGETPEGSSEEGYTDAMRNTFVSVCSTQGGTADLCDCAWNQIVQTVPYETYREFETAFIEGSTTSLPPMITDAVSACTDDLE